MSSLTTTENGPAVMDCATVLDRVTKRVAPSGERRNRVSASLSRRRARVTLHCDCAMTASFSGTRLVTGDTASRPPRAARGDAMPDGAVGPLCHCCWMPSMSSQCTIRVRSLRNASKATASPL